jgi:hypothetical protein
MSAGAISNDFHTTQAVASSDIFGSANFNPNAMTPDTLLIYLGSRMGSLDNQMGEVFNRQKTSEKLRSELHAIQQELTTIDSKDDKHELVVGGLTQESIKEIDAHIRNIEAIDPKLGADVRKTMFEDGQIASRGDQNYYTYELDNSKEYLNMVAKDLESSAQMDMISLQSLMGARQTAIQLSTNLISALNESQKSVVGNIR